ncbi:MAG: carbon-nitrogen hydrolase family protein [Campylobacteraceae bacterium]|nr:carbon-nitrogen hydrolase family protein [Campylobacteraceae bacterium]
MISSKNLCAIQFAYAFHSFEENFETLQQLILQTPKDAIVLAPELCISGYSYQNMDQAALFSQIIIPKLKALSMDKTIGLTLIEKNGENFVNNFKLFHRGENIQTRTKSKLFTMGDENIYFKEGNLEEINILEIDGIKIATLICFELRFTKLWEQIKGADVILIPSFWGKLRKEHFETLTKALAIMNQSYVICANSVDDTMAGGSGIITPFGEAYRDDSRSLISAKLEMSEIKKMRKYLDIGLH